MKRILVFTAVVAIIAVSCEDRIDLLDSIPPVVTKTEVYQFAEAQTELGNTIEIPYTIDNLKKALETLPPETKAAIKEEDFAPTHYYVRFAPKDMAELDLLINLSPRVIWSEVPLDREVITGGIYYHDPSLPEDRPTYQYSTVSISRWPALDTLSVEHEILLEAFMPDYEDVPDTKTSSSENILSPELESLLRKAYEMAGQEYESVGMTKGSTWYPSGYIKAYDNFAGIVPISKVRDLMRSHDVYVLASDANEGWGAVVNEALEEGMKVLGTYEAGASAAMLPADDLFHAGDWRRLAELLVRCVKEKRDGKLVGQGIGEWTPEKAAQRLVTEGIGIPEE